MRVKFEGTCCTDCAEMSANGTCDDGSRDDEQNARMLAHLGQPDLMHMCLGDDETEFSWASCDACGTHLGGARFAFVVLEEG